MLMKGCLRSLCAWHRPKAFHKMIAAVFYYTIRPSILLFLSLPC